MYCNPNAYNSNDIKIINQLCRNLRHAFKNEV